MTFSVYQRNAIIVKVCKLCIKQPGITVKQVAEILGESNNTARRWVILAEDNGYLAHKVVKYPRASNYTFLYSFTGKQLPTQTAPLHKVKRPVGRPAADDLRRPPVKPFRDPLIAALFGPARAEVQA